MALTANAALDFIRHTLGASSQLDARTIVNQAGRHLVSMHAWRWLQRPDYLLDELAPLSITGATWTESTKTLTKVAGFTGYTFRGGDRWNNTAGTGATTGSYRIASRVSADAITLEQSIGAAANGQTNIAGNIVFPYIQLPPDFRELIDLTATVGLLQNVQLTTLSELLSFRTHAVPVSNFVRYVAVSYQHAGGSGGAPTPRLEVYPTPTVALAGGLTLFYRAGWTDISDDSDVISVPPWMELLFLQVLGAVARGFEEEDQASMTARVTELRVGALFLAAVRDDADLEPSLGPIQGGSVPTYGQPRAWAGPYDYQIAAGPS